MDRRKFLRTAGAGIAGLTIIPSFASARTLAPSDTVRLGFIGLGQQAMFLMSGFLQIPGVEIVAGCDVYGIKRERFLKRATDFYSKAGKNIKPDLYEKYTDVLERKDIDAVVIATPDHWHAIIAIAACNAGKDVYLEKPMTFTIYEGQQVVKAVRKNNRVMQIGSQQRSDAVFQHATKLVQNGTLGKISNVNAYVGAPPRPYDLPKESIPADLNWDLWLGPLPEKIHYNKELNPTISLSPERNETFWGAWRWYKEMGGGFTTDWGAHMFDIAQWGLGMDKNGPLEIIPAGYGNTKYLTYKYAGDITMTEEPFDERKTQGVKFWGEKGWIEVARGYFKASDPAWNPSASSGNDGPYETRIPHQFNFIECVRSRKDPVVTAEIGHSSCSTCTLGNIAYELKRPIQWNPTVQKFVKDPEATKLLHYKYRKGYKL